MIHISRFQNLLLTAAFKTLWCGHKDRLTNQWNKLGSKNKPSHIWLIFSKSAMFNEEMIVFSTNGARKLGIHELKNETDPQLTLYRKIRVD